MSKKNKKDAPPSVKLWSQVRLRKETRDLLKGEAKKAKMTVARYLESILLDHGIGI